MAEKKTGYSEHLHLNVPATIIYTALFALSGFLLTLNTRVAVLESSETKIEQSIEQMSQKIDKIYDKLTFEK